MIPCLTKNSLKLLVGTADERYNYSPDYFRNTHFPQILHRYYGNELVDKVTEAELFEVLKDVDTNGNRLFFLLGSTGSGKSELLVWIKDKWHEEEIQRPVIRISRSELNPQILIKKCFDTIGVSMDFSLDANRWDILLSKPISIINQIVWSSLSEMLATDEEIVPIALLIRPFVEQNVLAFTKQVMRGRITKQLEVISLEQFKSLIATTSASFPFEFQVLRKKLISKLDQFLFSGWDINMLFNKLFQHIKINNIRPLLLIDDLVQSMNIYASELLDRLINLEECNWDVIVGLTPGIMHDIKDSTNLNRRILNLDTIDDRVIKLWLSDESGKEYYNLKREQVVPYMTNYLKYLKQVEGYGCSMNCPHFSNCDQINYGETGTTSNRVQLLPFNEPMINRVFDSIPTGKGKLRYMILNTKELIRFFQKGKKESLSRVLPLIQRESFADSSDPFIKTLAEWYVSENNGYREFFVPEQILACFGYEAKGVKVNMRPITGIESGRELVVRKLPNENGNLEKLSIRDWVEGKTINPELLESVRLGIASLVHDVRKPINISRQFTSRTTALIQKNGIKNRIRLPIVFEHEEVRVSQNIILIEKGYSPVELSNFHKSRPQEKMMRFQQVSDQYDIATWIYKADILNNQWVFDLESLFGISMYEFALNFKIFVDDCMEVEKSFWSYSTKMLLNRELSNFAENCFEDWFLLRDNMMDYNQMNKTNRIDFELWLMNLKVISDFNDYKIGEKSLFEFLTTLQQEYDAFSQHIVLCINKLIEDKSKMIGYLASHGDLEHSKLALQIDYFRKCKNYTLNDFKAFSKLNKRLEVTTLIEEYEQYVDLIEETKNLKDIYNRLCDEIQFIFHEHDISVHEKKNMCYPSLTDQKITHINLIKEMELLKRVLSYSDKNKLKYVLSTNAEIKSVHYVKALWSKIVDIGLSLLEGNVSGSLLISTLSEWETLNLNAIKKDVVHHNKHLILIEKFVGKLCEEMLGHENKDKNLIINSIEKNDKIRPAVKRQLTRLINEGFSSLPSNQASKLLEDLKEDYPKTYRSLKVRLVVGDK